LRDCPAMRTAWERASAIDSRMRLLGRIQHHTNKYSGHPIRCNE
jgi:hypothetical protein